LRNSHLATNLRQLTRIDTELLHAGDQSGALQTHAGGSTVSSAHASSGFLQDAQELFPLVGVGHRGYSFLGGTVAQIRHRNLQGRTTSENYCSLNQVFQFANVSLSVPAGQLPHTGSGNRFDLLLHAEVVLLGDGSERPRSV